LNNKGGHLKIFIFPNSWCEGVKLSESEFPEL